MPYLMYSLALFITNATCYSQIRAAASLASREHGSLSCLLYWRESIRVRPPVLVRRSDVTPVSPKLARLTEPILEYERADNNERCCCRRLLDMKLMKGWRGCIYYNRLAITS